MTASLVWLLGVLGANGYYKPSSYSLASDPIMMILFVSAWGAAGTACLAIGVATLLTRWRHITLSANAASVFGGMLVLIGFDFWLSLTTVFIAVYRLKVVVLGATAAVTVTAAVLTLSQILGAARGDRGE